MLWELRGARTCMFALRTGGIGQALLSKVLRDDRARGSLCSVLTASHTGALLYSRVGYERIGTLFMFAPRRQGVS
jgi:predicted acetyltransferase